MPYITLSGKPHNAMHSPSISLPVRQEVDGLVHPGIHSEQLMPLKLRSQTIWKLKSMVIWFIAPWGYVMRFRGEEWFRFMWM